MRETAVPLSIATKLVEYYLELDRLIESSPPMGNLVIAGENQPSISNILEISDTRILFVTS